MSRCFWPVLLFAVLAVGPADVGRAADPVTDYEGRLEEIAREVLTIRQELEALVAEVVEGETASVRVFLENPKATWRQSGVRLVLDGKTVFSRTFSAAEQDVLEKGLPLELAQARLPAGDHEVALAGFGEEVPPAARLTAERGGVHAWVAGAGKEGVQWRVE